MYARESWELHIRHGRITIAANELAKGGDNIEDDTASCNGENRVSLSVKLMKHFRQKV